VTFEPDPRFAEALARVRPMPFDGEAWKHTFAGQRPDAPNTRGARWNPPGVPAIYFALQRATAIAEGNHLVALQSPRIERGRAIHRIAVSGLSNVLDLQDGAVLRSLGVGSTELSANDFSPSQRVGGTAEWLGHDALLVPSARATGANLVIFERRTDIAFRLVPVALEPLET
jgi:RES domain-containing protein